MNRRRRLAAVAALALAVLGGSTVAAQADVVTASTANTTAENRHGDWYCVYVDTVTFTYCQGNPLPPRLPLPENQAGL